MKANKGEWSEFYAFLKILQQRKLPAADKNLKAIANKFFIFKKIFKRNKPESNIIFDLTSDNIIIKDKHGYLIKELNNLNLNDSIKQLYHYISSSKETTFSIPIAEELLGKLMLDGFKATNFDKADIEAVIYDRVSEKDEMLGFSIKSMIGCSSTLLNAGETTNFVYKVSRLSDDLINTINSINSKSKIKDRLSSIIKSGACISFNHILKEHFNSNLKKIDTIAPIFIAKMLLYFFEGKANKITELVKLLGQDEELKIYGLSLADYEFKIKALLISCALGMVPSRIWDGYTKAYGGYIVVKSDGEVVCYHLYNRDEFSQYLYENTKLESASSSRHKYGQLYKINNELFFNLNLQIRFIN